MVSFNENLTNWCTCSAKDMSYMFAGARSFNGDVSNFVTNMEAMFEGAAVCEYPFNHHRLMSHSP